MNIIILLTHITIITPITQEYVFGHRYLFIVKLNLHTYIAEAALITMAVIESTKHYKSTQEITTS